MPQVQEDQKTNTGKEAAAYSPTLHLRGTVSSLFTIIMTFCLMLLKISNQYRKILYGTQNIENIPQKHRFFKF
jgi:flagellar biogenesis protein FliO